MVIIGWFSHYVLAWRFCKTINIQFYFPGVNHSHEGLGQYKERKEGMWLDYPQA
jgi:hypothetical protein